MYIGWWCVNVGVVLLDVVGGVGLEFLFVVV